MTMVALMAAGAHGMSLSAPALAEQAQQKEAASEHAVIPHAPTAASDSMPVPILAGGVVLAFAVGLSGGMPTGAAVWRVVRAAGGRGAAAGPRGQRAGAARPAAAGARDRGTARDRAAGGGAAEGARPAAAGARDAGAARRCGDARADPAAARAATRTGARARPGAARAARAPARPSQPLRLVPRAQAPRPPATDAPLAETPELPRAQPEAVAAEAIMPPLTEAPEALQVPPSAEAPEPQLPPAGPARRFARVAQWPDEAVELWTCELDWKAGYRKANFRAMVAAPGDAKRRPLGESAAVRWALMGEPEPPTPELAVRVRALVEALEGAGWEHIGRGRRWYEQRFLWRGDGEPQPIVVSGLAAGDASD